ncbi:MAG: hypothetical protein IJD78_07590 [Clostridia bacterium]|nr:hypothetical protein [Clostridia bacterium]
MKRIIALISTLLMIVSLASCSEPTKPGEFEQGPVEIAQNEIISGLGITQKDSRIVAFLGTNEYLRYVVCFYENGIKTDEITHMFYTSDISFENAKKTFEGNKNVTEITDESRYISYWSGVALYGTYEEDLKLIEKEYMIK